MGKNIDQAILDAASNVACEGGDLSKEELLKIREQLVGNSKKSDNSFIYELYKDHEGINIHSFDKEYLVSFMNRNDKKVEHLLITNY